MRSVIIVDDEEDCRDSLHEALELSGIDVAGTGANGEEACQLYEKFLPDVTILDLNMPDFDGNYAIEKIKRKYPDARIIVVTGFADFEFDQNKVDGVICKPYSSKELTKLMKKICSPLNSNLTNWYVG